MPLKKPINHAEVLTAFKKLQNGKAQGPDGISAEMFKYAPKELARHLANVINYEFENHLPLKLGEGILIPLQKPGKPKGPRKSLRPITLVVMKRKVVAAITHGRIGHKLQLYMSKNQSAYTPRRGTSDVVWMHR